MEHNSLLASHSIQLGSKKDEISLKPDEMGTLIIAHLQAYVRDRHNVHQVIKKCVLRIRTIYTELGDTVNANNAGKYLYENTVTENTLVAQAC